MPEQNPLIFESVMDGNPNQNRHEKLATFLLAPRRIYCKAGLKTQKYFLSRAQPDNWAPMGPKS